jgi:hypothetical protein
VAVNPTRASTSPNQLYFDNGNPTSKTIRIHDVAGKPWDSNRRRLQVEELLSSIANDKGSEGGTVFLSFFGCQYFQGPPKQQSKETNLEPPADSLELSHSDALIQFLKTDTVV